MFSFLSRIAHLLFFERGLVLVFFSWSVSACMLSRVLLFATSWTVVCQAPLSMGFSRQQYWSGVPFPTPGDRTCISRAFCIGRPPAKPFLKYGWFTVPLSFRWTPQWFSYVIHTCVCIRFSSLTGFYVILSVVPCVNSRSSLVICFIFGTVYMLIPSSWRIPPFLFGNRKSVFCVCRSISVGSSFYIHIVTQNEGSWVDPP